MTNSRRASATLMNLSDLTSRGSSVQSTAPLADVTNAPHLFGDVWETYGDSAYGDSAYGAPHHGHHKGGHQGHHSGHPHQGHSGGSPDPHSPLATWITLLGDPAPGAQAPSPANHNGGSFVGNAWNKFRGQSTGAQIAEGAGLTALLGLGGVEIAKALKHHKDRKHHTSQQLNDAHNRQTIDNMIDARQVMGPIPHNSHLKFFDLVGAHLNSAPISPTEYYPADMLKHNLDRQNSDTPFEQETCIGVASGSGPTWTVSSTGLSTNRFYACVILIVGVNILSGSPGTIYTMTGSMPLFNGGTLTINSTYPFTFTLNYPYYSEFMIFPWTIVTNKPLLTLGQYSSSTAITFSITGLPSTATFNMIIPGSQHTWSIAMRNRLVKA